MIDTPFSPQEMGVGAAIVFAAWLVAVVIWAKTHPVEPYQRLASVLTPPEQYFYNVLASLVQGRVLIFPKVRIADILKVRRSMHRKDFWGHFKNISQKHIDFVLVDPKDFTTLCAIELDDKSHGRFERIKRDKFINQIMAQTGIPLYRFAVARRYDRAEILQTLQRHLNP